MKNTAVVLVILGIFVLCGCTTLYHVKSNDFKIESVNNQALVFGSYHTDYLINPDINMYDYFISIRLKPVGNDSSKEYFLDMDQKQGYIMAVLKPGKYQVNQLVFNANGQVNPLVPDTFEMDLTNGQVFYLGNISTSISMDWSYILAGINSETSNNLESDKLYFYQKNSALSNWQFSVNNNTIYVKKQRLLGY